MSRIHSLPGMKAGAPRRNAIVMAVYGLALYVLYWLLQLLVTVPWLPVAPNFHFSRAFDRRRGWARPQAERIAERRFRESL